MTPYRKAQIAAAAKCHELVARERAELEHRRAQGGDVASLERIRRGIQQLEEAADAIMALEEMRMWTEAEVAEMRQPENCTHIFGDGATGACLACGKVLE